MSSLSTNCGGGGWTLVMKLDGHKVKNFIANKINFHSDDSTGSINVTKLHSSQFQARSFYASNIYTSHFYDSR